MRILVAVAVFAPATVALVTGISAQSSSGVRAHTRRAPSKGTLVTGAQAEDLTLTLAAADIRPIQTWIRTAGTIDASHKLITAAVGSAEAPLVRVGQRVRAFPPSSRSSMYQAFVTRVEPRTAGAVVTIALVSAGRDDSPDYLVEIVAERGPFLSVPNEAIIEEGDRHVVYVEQGEGQYAPVDVQLGIQGELYTQIVSGLDEGAKVVTIGSFFIDAEHKLKGATTDLSAR